MSAPSFNKTVMAVAVAATLSTAAPVAEAVVLNLSWRGAFTFINTTGQPLRNSPSDYVSGYYANGDSASTTGTPWYPGNVGPGATGPYANGGMYTAHGWKGHRTPVSGMLAFDTSNGVGVGTVNPFFFFGDTPGNGNGTQVNRLLEVTFQTVDSVGTIVGTMLMSWKGGHSVSIVLDGSGLLGSLPAMVANGPTSSISGVGTLPATDGTNFGDIKNPLFLPLGPSPIATKTRNALGCEAQPLATQVNAYTITPTGNIANCTYTNDTIGGSPMVSAAFPNHNLNLDMTWVHYVSTNFGGDPVPLPPAVWLFGSGLLGLIGLARRKKSG